jgi:hypothetical protein
MTIAEFAMAKLANSDVVKPGRSSNYGFEAFSAKNEAPSARNELESAPFRTERCFAQSSLNEILNDFPAEEASERLKKLRSR